MLHRAQQWTCGVPPFSFWAIQVCASGFGRADVSQTKQWGPYLDSPAKKRLTLASTIQQGWYGTGERELLESQLAAFENTVRTAKYAYAEQTEYAAPTGTSERGSFSCARLYCTGNTSYHPCLSFWSDANSQNELLVIAQVAPHYIFPPGLSDCCNAPGQDSAFIGSVLESSLGLNQSSRWLKLF